MNEMMNEVKEQQRRDTRRAWWFGLGIVVALLIVVGILWSQDAPPPDDAAMLPTYTEGGGKENALLEFVEEVKVLSDPGYNDLSQEARERRWEAKKEMMDWLAQPQNVKRMEAWERLAASDSDQWRWRLQDVERIDINFDWSGVGHLQSTSNLLRVRSLLLAREGKLDEAIDVALEIWRVGNGLMKAEGSLMHWLVGITIRGIGIWSVHDVLTIGEADEARLAAVQRRIAIMEESVVPALGGALKVEYQFMKSHVVALREDPSSVNPQFNRLLMALAFKENQTLRTFLHCQQPIVDASNRERGEFLRALEGYRVQIEEWNQRGWWRLIHPNGLGREMIMETASLRSTHIGERGLLNDAMPALMQMMLAVRRFELKEGRLPVDENELAPNFMETLPIDPFSGKPLRWNQSNLKAYTVWRNGVDDGGDFIKPMNDKMSDVGIFYPWGTDAKLLQEEEYGTKDDENKEPPTKRKRLWKGSQKAK